MNRFFMSTRPSASPSGGMSTSSVNDVTILPNAAPRMTAMARSSTFPRMTNALNSLSIGSGVKDEMEADGRACGRPPPLARGIPAPGPRLTKPPSADYLQIDHGNDRYQHPVTGRARRSAAGRDQ